MSRITVQDLSAVTPLNGAAMKSVVGGTQALDKFLRCMRAGRVLAAFTLGLIRIRCQPPHGVVPGF